MVDHSTDTFGFSHHLHDFSVFFIVKRAVFQIVYKTVGIFDSFVCSLPVLVDFATLIIAVEACITVVGSYVCTAYHHFYIAVEDEGSLESFSIQVVYKDRCIYSIKCAVDFCFLAENELFAVA